MLPIDVIKALEIKEKLPEECRVSVRQQTVTIAHEGFPTRHGLDPGRMLVDAVDWLQSLKVLKVDCASCKL